MTSLQDIPPPSPFTLDRDLLARNLEAKRAEGYSCPHCQNTFSLKLRLDTKDTIIDGLAQGNPYDKLISCDNNDCNSVEEQDDGSFLVTPFVRRISAQDDGTITIETFPLDELLREAADLRDRRKVATQNEVALRAAHQREIENLRRSFDERLATAVTETTQLSAGLIKNTSDLFQGTTEELEVAHRTIAEIDRMLGVQAENRLAALKDRVAASDQLAEICRLGNMPPDGLLERARSWSEKPENQKKK